MAASKQNKNIDVEKVQQILETQSTTENFAEVINIIAESTENNQKQNFFEEKKENLNEVEKQKINHNLKEHKVEQAFKTSLQSQFDFDSWLKAFKDEYEIHVFDDIGFKDFLTSSLQVKPDESFNLGPISEKIKNDPNFFQNLQIEGVLNQDITAFVFLILKGLFRNISQKTIYSSSLIKPLLANYSQRLTIGNLNNNLIILQFKSISQSPKKKQKKSSKISKLLESKIKILPSSFKILFSAFEVDSSYEILSLYCQSKLKPETVLNSINPLEKHLGMQFHNYKTLNRFDTLLFHESLLSNEGNKDYIIEHYNKEKRGGMTYNFPNTYKRFGLFVHREGGAWLAMDNRPGEWPVAYTSVKDIVLNPDLAGKANENPKTQGKFPLISKDGIQVAVNVITLENYLDVVHIFGKKYVVAFQCRINPDLIQYTTSQMKDVYVLDRNEPDSIRAYGILIKEIK